MTPTLWIRADALEFDAACEACAARVAEALRLDVDVRWATCPRGHRLRVRRIVNVGRRRRRRLRAAEAAPANRRAR